MKMQANLFLQHLYFKLYRELWFYHQSYDRFLNFNFISNIWIYLLFKTIIIIIIINYIVCFIFLT